MELKDRVAVITGATGGLGSTVARTLAGRGMNLALLDKDPARLAALAESLPTPDSRLFIRCVNLLEAAESNAAADAILVKFGKIDILLHLIGGWTGGKSLVEASSDDLTFMLNQHIWTSFNVIRAFVPHITKNSWGRVIMVTSPFAERPKARGGLFAVGKAGQEAMMLALSQELKGTNVTANLLQVKTIDINHEKVNSPSPENTAWTTPEELTASILNLLSEEAGILNGAKIPLFGSF
jgi:NADP-dependent 3-hydroxy acid dehydrogenase YdfG